MFLSTGLQPPQGQGSFLFHEESHTLEQCLAHSNNKILKEWNNGLSIIYHGSYSLECQKTGSSPSCAFDIHRLGVKQAFLQLDFSHIEPKMQRLSNTIILSKIAHISDPHFFSFLNDMKSDIMKELGIWNLADLDWRLALEFTSTVTLGRSLNLSKHAPQYAGNNSYLVLGRRIRSSLSKCLKVPAT